MNEKDDNYPVATIKEVDGHLVLDDPHALAMIHTIEKANCRAIYELNTDRIFHFKKRIEEQLLSPKEVVIMVINVDDYNGGLVADILMPNYNWQETRDKGETPVARGLASRDGMQELLKSFDKEASEKLVKFQGVAVVVIDCGVAEIFPIPS